MLVIRLFSVDIDGWCGILVALLIIRAGIKTAHETIKDILGKPPEKVFIDEIESIVLSHRGVLGVHDIIVHDYGPGRMMISLHGEVDGNSNLFKVHEMIDSIEKELADKLGCEAVIHIDPVATDDKLSVEMKEKVTEIVGNIDPILTVHDLRVIHKNNTDTVFFDMVVPFDFKLEDDELKSLLSEKLEQSYPGIICVINIDRPYT